MSIVTGKHAALVLPEVKATMTTTARSGPRAPSWRYLEDLERELRALGVQSELITSGAWPQLQLGRQYSRSNADSTFEDHVLAPSMPGVGWSFWWPIIELIGPARDPAQAARIIADQVIAGAPGGLAELMAAHGRPARPARQGIRPSPGLLLITGNAN